jgi:vesicle coat complex subunit
MIELHIFKCYFSYFLSITIKAISYLIKKSLNWQLGKIYKNMIVVISCCFELTNKFLRNIISMIRSDLSNSVLFKLI